MIMWILDIAISIIKNLVTSLTKAFELLGFFEKQQPCILKLIYSDFVVFTFAKVIENTGLLAHIR